MVAPRRRVSTGIAISPVELRAADVRLRSGEDWRRPLDPPPPDGGVWPSLVGALQELARAVGASGGSLAVALLSPLTEVRRVELPPARTEDLQLLLARGASRYFVNARGPQLVGVSALPRGARSDRASVVAAAASARLIASIRASAQTAGWNIASIAPAESAWASAAIATWPAFARDAGFVVVAHDDRTDLLQLEQGQLVAVRRFRAGNDEALMIAEATGSGARVALLGAPHLRGALSGALMAHGLRMNVATGAADDAASTAAQYADGAAGPVLKTDDTVARERVLVRRARWLTGATAVSLLMIAAAVELWGVHHHLDRVRREREALKPSIASTLVGRTTIEAAFTDLAALSAADRDAPQWSAVIAALTDALPDDAHLTAIRARGDSIVVDGLADHAAPVFDALAAVPSLGDVKAAAPVRRELQDDGTSLEHFVIAARLRAPAGGARVAQTSTAPAPERAR